ncbi:MAG: sodium:proton antiporter [Planctomycetaceae bacterium]|nr:sodium:proton antiporter [Planctomycetaceae bacterium]
MTRQHNHAPGHSSIIFIADYPPDEQLLDEQLFDERLPEGKPSKEQPHGPEHEIQPSKLMFPVAVALILLLLVYGCLLFLGLPQQWTKTANAEHHATEYAEEAHPEHGAEVEKQHPPYFMIAPFAILLLCVAILPLIPATAHWWEHNRNKLMVAGSLGLLTLLYYLLGCNFPVEQHLIEHKIIDPAEVGGFAVAKTMFMNAIVAEFLPFIVLLFALFTITGGIRITSSLKATPLVNCLILLLGSVLASFIGTTGAAMLLIRPLLDMNRDRKHKVHTLVFFIFTVCNCGGCLTPLGDPPLFLGYLRGVPFEWTFNLWVEWAFMNLLLITFYYLWDTHWYYRKEEHLTGTTVYLDGSTEPSLSISGWMLNVSLLLGVVAAVAFLDPGRVVPGTDWHPWYYLREAVQLGLAAVSLLFSSAFIRKENVFNFLAIGEVAALFFGIFICMQAPLQILNVEGKNIVNIAKEKTGLKEPMLFFWATGSLSAVLDNAPTYVVFFETARSLSPNSMEELVNDPHHRKLDDGKWYQFDDDGKKVGEMVPVGKGFIEFHLLVAISLGSVFMGAMTYIGNGPNFLIKAVAEQDGVKMPSFFGYMVYSCLILLPLLVVMTLIFL